MCRRKLFEGTDSYTTDIEARTHARIGQLDAWKLDAQARGADG